MTCPRFICVLVLAAALLSGVAHAKNPEQPETAVPPGSDMTFLDHAGTGPFWFGAEANSILQAHPSFPAKYPNDYTDLRSLHSDSEAAISGLFTVFGAYRPFRTTELILDPEMAVGGGISQAQGLAGFTNLDVVRNPSLPKVPYIGRAEIHQLIPLSQDWEPNEDRGPISSFTYVPRHRLELRVGKMSTADIFDVNPAASDSHMQFMNWAVDNNGAYDYAADTRGYTYGAIVEYQGPRFELRFGEMLMPIKANGPDLDWGVSKNRAENLELELKYRRESAWAGTVRLLAYQNNANMGSYQEAIDAFESHVDAKPDITVHRQAGRSKRGLGVNVIQNLWGVARGFVRLGWNDGKNETFAYTEIDNTFEVGGDVRGLVWKRPDDRIGIAFVSSGLSSAHREYLRLGGIGFIIGDGNLNYARETIVEQYYNFHVWRGAFLAEDFQFVVNPAYNADRGPVSVISLRGHLEF
jgi:high affinity Mn2+ porin